LLYTHLWLERRRVDSCRAMAVSGSGRGHFGSSRGGGQGVGVGALQMRPYEFRGDGVGRHSSAQRSMRHRHLRGGRRPVSTGGGTRRVQLVRGEGRHRHLRGGRRAAPSTEGVYSRDMGSGNSREGGGVATCEAEGELRRRKDLAAAGRAQKGVLLTRHGPHIASEASGPISPIFRKSCARRAKINSAEGRNRRSQPSEALLNFTYPPAVPGQACDISMPPAD
jgi:hypothetical protein